MSVSLRKKSWWQFNFPNTLSTDSTT